MSPIAQLIYQEVQGLPEHLAQEVYDFLRFVEARRGTSPAQASSSPEDHSAAPGWRLLDPSRELAHLQGAVPSGVEAKGESRS